MNRLVERIRAMLQRKQIVPPDDIEDLCDETDALQDVIDRIAKRDAEVAYQAEREGRD
jgi:ubiquinone biosynthesis protein UbiJ